LVKINGQVCTVLHSKADITGFVITDKIVDSIQGLVGRLEITVIVRQFIEMA